MAERTLIIGTKSWSSWSLRPWLALKMGGFPFEEVVVQLRQPDTAARIARHSPSGKVPLLIEGDLKVWDSLAICEHVAESAPTPLWPSNAETRAIARSASAEMHSGFATLRELMPMDVAKQHPAPSSTPALDADIARILELWGECRARFGAGGPFLFGAFSIADAMFAPVVTRFTTYGVTLSPVAKSYVAAVTALPAMQDWIAGARAEGV
jgi:glutathione S-transferase